MADNGMNNIAEPELQLEQLEQVSGGTPEDPAAEPKTTKTAKVISRRVTSL